jgi:hypothetical protein
MEKIPGKTKTLFLKLAIEIVDLPIKPADFSYVGLPEASWHVYFHASLPSWINPDLRWFHIWRIYHTIQPPKSDVRIGHGFGEHLWNCWQTEA